MKKNSLIISLVGVLFFINGGIKLQAQQRTGAKGSKVFSIYDRKDIANRDLTYRDMRLMRMKRVIAKYSMPDYKSLSQWKKKKKNMREQILISAGLWPLPPATPLNARIFDKTVHKKYTVEKVYIEVYPSFYLAGNLYKPRGIKGPFPGVLMPHGHWKNGRLQNGRRPSVAFHFRTPKDPWNPKKGDRPSTIGRASVPGRCIHFAKAGYVAFSYDMVGYTDTQQIGHDFAEKDRLANLWGINLLGLQLQDSRRALQFLRSRPSVDSTKIGLTGASGGGTQTFLLNAITDSNKIDVTAPVNMISSVFQGGGLCENAPGLRLNAFNVEIAAMFAPRPQLMVANSHDWTRNTPWAEYPMMKSIYKLYNAGDHVDYAYFDYPHNYNKASRQAVYRWFQKWMPGKRSGALTQPESFTVEPDSNLLVFLKRPVLDRDLTFSEMDPARYHNLPSGALDMNEQALKKYLEKTAREQLNKYWPSNKSQWTRFESIYSTAYQHIIADSIPKSVNAKIVEKGKEKGFSYKKIFLEQGKNHDWIPGVFFQPLGQKYKSKGVTLIISPDGKSGISNKKGIGPNKLVQKLLSRGQSVMAIDVFKKGEHLLPKGVPTERDEKIPKFTTYNKTDAQQQIQDILTTGKYLNQKFSGEKINLVGLRQAGIWCILASPLTKSFDSITGDASQLNPNEQSQWLPFFIPGLAKYGGLKTALALSAKGDQKMFIYNVNSNIDSNKVKSIYKMFGRSKNLTLTHDKLTSRDILQNVGF